MVESLRLVAYALGLRFKSRARLEAENLVAHLGPFSKAYKPGSAPSLTGQDPPDFGARSHSVTSRRCLC